MALLCEITVPSLPNILWLTKEENKTKTQNKKHLVLIYTFHFIFIASLELLLL